MIVTFHFALIVVGKKLTGDDFGAAEIKRRSGDRFQAVVRNAAFINRQIFVRQNLQLVIAHVRLLAVKIEIDVISHIHRARFINCGAISNGDTVIVGQTILHRRAEITREALITII